MEISALQGKNLTELCRCCLTTSNYMTKFTAEDEKVTMLSSILNFEVEIDENMPQFICECCVRLLETSYEFQQLLKKSTKLIQSVVVLHKPDKEDESTLMESEETTENMEANPIEVIYLEEATHNDISSEGSQRSSVLQTHLELHTSKSFKCDICEKTFCQQAQLRCHMRQHTGEKSHFCDTCGNGFKQKSHLEEHMRIHTDDRPFKCEHCGRCFTKKYSLKSHLNIHLGFKPYKCDQCSFSTRKNCSLTLHKIRHLKKTDKNPETL